MDHHTKLFGRQNILYITILKDLIIVVIYVASFKNYTLCNKNESYVIFN